MTNNNIKIAVFAALIVAMILPFNMMDVSGATGKTENTIMQKEKPIETKLDKDTKKKVKELFQEKLDLLSEGEEIESKYKTKDASEPTSEDSKKMDIITKRLNEISGEFGIINEESRKLYAVTPQEKIALKEGRDLISKSDIPYIGLGTDYKTGAIQVDFESQKIADKYIPMLEEMLSVSFYIEIKDQDIDLDCVHIRADCNPIVGGIEIGGKKLSNWGACSISIPVTRNGLFFTSEGIKLGEDGFITAAHCFGDNTPNLVKQPHDGNIIGEVTAMQNSGECDCAFVKNTSSKSDLFGFLWGKNKVNLLTSKEDPQLGDYVVMLGRTSGFKVGKIISVDYDSNGISNMHKINQRMNDGDSGGPVIDVDTLDVYHGLVKGGSVLPASYTSIVPWSHIDAALNLR